MESEKLKVNFQQSMETLSDLYKLGQPAVYPLIDRLHYHVQEINDLANKRLGTKRFKSLESLYVNSINDQIKNSFQKNGFKSNISVINQFDSPSLSNLEKILLLFPESLKLCHEFQFKKFITVSLRNDGFSFEGLAPIDLDLESLRMQAYQAIRCFLNERCLFTFNIFETNSVENFKIKFNFTIEDSLNAPFAIRLSENKEVWLSSVVKSFIVPHSDFSKFQNYPTLLIDKNLNVRHHENAQNLIFKSDSEARLFHFPFLFRPLSLIIKRNFLESSEDVGSHSFDNTFNDLDIIKIDLFKIFQK